MEQSTEVYPEDRDSVEKLAKLQDMHQQINELRGLLPDRLLRPTRMAIENPRGISPEKFAANLKKAASDGSRDIQRFKRDFQSTEMRDILQKTNSSDFPQGRDSWTADYRALAKRPKADSGIVQVADSGNPADTTQTEDYEAVIKNFESAQSVLKFDRISSSGPLPVDAIVDGMSFRITQKENKGTNELLVATSPNSTTSNLMPNIVTHVNKRDNTRSLEFLLGMLASYHDLKFRACQKCNNIFDKGMNYPLLRRPKPTEDKDAKVEWEVLHNDCAS